MRRAPILLVGPMGVGKSTVGRQLARELQLPFYDSDRVIEDRTGADIPWIFDVEGEAGFRRRETEALRDILGEEQSVIATGGGIVLAEENRRLIKARGFTVYLTASIEQLCLRTSKDKKRPLLQVDNPEERIRSLLQQRDPLYREVANLVVCTNEHGIKHTIAEIIAAYREFGAL